MLAIGSGELKNRSPEEIWLSGVFDNINSPSLAISNMFDAPPLDVSLDEALAHFDLHVQAFEDQQPQTDSLLTEAQAQPLSAILEI